METNILLSQGALQVPCKLSQPDCGSIRRVVLGVHGLGGSANDQIQTGIAEEMSLFDSAVIRFDFPGHGESPMTDKDLNLTNCVSSLLAAARLAKARYPQVEDLCVFATGFGAYVTLAALEEILELPGTVKLVVQTPSVQMSDTLLAMGRISEPTLRAMDGVLFRAERPFRISYSFYQEMRDHPVLLPQPIPMLILQGEEDAYIPMSDIRLFHQINDRSKLVIIPGTSHRFLEDGAWDMVLDLTRDWFEFEQVLVCDWE